MLGENNKKNKILPTLIALVLSISSIFISVMAWMTLSGVSSADPIIIGTTSKEITIERSFIVNATYTSYNTQYDVNLKDYDPYIMANNVDSNAIMFIEISVSEIERLYLSLIPKSILEDEIGLTDVCYMQIFKGILQYH
ncbi:hypothetical protein LJC17_01610 [Acholeplasma sp. OttesenSCG-928-E16]|nr:hypothetical protein [Acholeplasma sp. OttesenSCG-928-E16]